MMPQRAFVRRRRAAARYALPRRRRLANVEAASDGRSYSAGLEGVIAGETALSLVDGERGRLLYRGYPIAELVEHGTYGQVAELLWTGSWPAQAGLTAAPLPEPVLEALRLLPSGTVPMDALRTAVSAWGAVERPGWPPSIEQARALTAVAPTALAAFARLRAGGEPIDPDPALDLASNFLFMLSGRPPDPSSARALDAYFIVAAEHGFNASTFTARVITSTRSDIASAVAGAIGALKGPLHGGAPSEVVSQLHEIGSVDQAERWIRETVARGERLMGFGHRVYRAYDPRALALRTVAEGLAGNADWLAMAVRVEEIALRVLAELKPGRVIKTNVEFYTAAVLQGIGLQPPLYPATFAVARHAGWTAHALEQAAANRLIRPSVRYVGPDERHLPLPAEPLSAPGPATRR
jgi:citrate synthase